MALLVFVIMKGQTFIASLPFSRVGKRRQMGVYLLVCSWDQTFSSISMKNNKL
ncbi:hypothetical protein PO124_30060 [Bacillus licheniformis]|nr:hypothetical protein [Bacillus licheniformis]